MILVVSLPRPSIYSPHSLNYTPRPALSLWDTVCRTIPAIPQGNIRESNLTVVLRTAIKVGWIVLMAPLPP